MSEQITPVVWGITDEHPEGIPVVPAWYHAAIIRQLQETEMEGPQLTYGITPRMDGTKEEKLAWRVMALREGLWEAATTDDAKAMRAIAESCLSVDDLNAGR